MTFSGPATRLTIFVNETDRYHHRPLYAEIVHRAHQAGLAGASVFRGMEGFGATSRIHTNRLLSLSQDLPLAIVIVDSRDAIERFLADIGDMVPDGLIVLDEVTVYRPGRPGGDSATGTAGQATGGSQA